MDVADYEPIDLSTLCNAGPEILGADYPWIAGPRSFRGLPFQIGRTDRSAGPSLVHFGSGGRQESLVVPLGRLARWVIVAHRLLESDLARGGPVGKQVAEYVFRFADGQSARVPIRERLEIAIVPSPWGGNPLLAVPDRQDWLLPRYEGRWDDAGRRQTEAEHGYPELCYLWAWANPRPEQPIESLEIVPTGPSFAVLAITLGHLDEHPFRHSGGREVVITQTREADASRPFGLEVEVDRGVTTYPYPLPPDTADGFLAEDFRGWGEPQRTDSGAAYALVAAIPSATITVKWGGEEIGRAHWGDVEKQGVVETPRMRVELVDHGRNWVHTTIVDASTGKPVPCRIHFRSPEGIPYQPHGHHQHVNSNNGTWNFDVGGDLRLGQITYAYTDGHCQGWLPTGDVIVDVARGYEYEPLRERIRIEPGQRELVLKLERWRDLNSEGWYSGDTHVHFLSTQGSHLEGAGEGLNVVNLLQSQWGHLFTSTEEFVGRPSVSADGQTIVYANQENRQHLLGHMILLGLKEPVMPWCSDGPDEAELGGTLETMLSHWADRCHAQGGTVILPHFPMPNGEPAALIATGRIDAVEMAMHAEFNHLDYYRYLNSGYRLPLVGGTDKMSSDVPVGLYRTYVRIPSDEGFTYDSWRRNLALGRTFVSGGPLLRLSVEGQEIGDTVMLSGNGGTVEVVAEAESILPIQRLELVERGRVVASTEETRPTRRLVLRERLRVSASTWIAARVGGAPYFESPHHYDGWGRGVFAHTSPVYVALGGDYDVFDAAGLQYMLTLVDGSLTYVREMSPQRDPRLVTHHHGETDHLAYLERPLVEAREALHRRLHEHGLSH